MATGRWHLVAGWRTPRDVCGQHETQEQDMAVAKGKMQGIFGESTGRVQLKALSTFSPERTSLAGARSAPRVRAGRIVRANPNRRFPGNYFWSLLDLITQ